LASLKAHHWKGHVYYALERSYWDPQTKTVKRKYLAYLGKNPGDPFLEVDPDLKAELRQVRKRRSRDLKAIQARVLHGPGREKIGSSYEKSSTRKRRRRGSGRRYLKRVVKRKKLTGLERQHLREYVKSYHEELRDADVDSYIDSSLSYEENKRILRDTFGIRETADWEEETEEEWEERRAYYEALGRR